MPAESLADVQIATWAVSPTWLHLLHHSSPTCSNSSKGRCTGRMCTPFILDTTYYTIQVLLVTCNNRSKRRCTSCMCTPFLTDSTYYTTQVLLVVIVVKVGVPVVCVPHSFLTPLVTQFKSYLSLEMIEAKVVVLVASCMYRYTQVLLDSTYYNFHRSCSSSGL